MVRHVLISGYIPLVPASSVLPILWLNLGRARRDRIVLGDAPGTTTRRDIDQTLPQISRQDAAACPGGCLPLPFLGLTWEWIPVSLR